MRTLRRYVATEIMAATAVVVVALAMLFAFFDLVDQIKDLGRGAYTLNRILVYMVLSLPDHVYVLFP
ncbi:MAG: LptF/LptG family permease, partial [Burkholderiales bacterium]